MNHFPHKPEVRFHLVCNMAQSLHKIKVKYVRRVKTDTIYIKLADPEADYITNIIFYGWISLIEFYQQVVSAPVIVAETIIVLVVAVKVYIAVPISIRRAFAFLLNVFKRKKSRPVWLNTPSKITLTSFLWHSATKFFKS